MGSAQTAAQPVLHRLRSTNSAIGMALGDTLSYESSDGSRSASAAIAEAQEHYDSALAAHKNIASTVSKLQIVTKSQSDLKLMASSWPCHRRTPQLPPGHLAALQAAACAQPVHL